MVNGGAEIRARVFLILTAVVSCVTALGDSRMLTLVNNLPEITQLVSDRARMQTGLL